MVVALSQFGHFSPLALNVSSTVDGYPGTDTFTFLRLHVPEPHICHSFPSRASRTSVRRGRTALLAGLAPWSKLQELSFAQQQLMAAYDPGCGYHFWMWGNRWTTIGAYADVQVVQGMSWTQIASALATRARRWRSLSKAGGAVDGPDL